jgi:hypothetical protein
LEVDQFFGSVEVVFDIRPLNPDSTELAEGQPLSFEGRGDEGKKATGSGSD